MCVESWLRWYYLAWKCFSNGKNKKPIIIATGASKFSEVKKIVDKVLKINKKLVLIPCNTNYTAEDKNMNYINLNVLKKYKLEFQIFFWSLSDHTFGHETALGAVAMG